MMKSKDNNIVSEFDKPFRGSQLGSSAPENSSERQSSVRHQEKTDKKIDNVNGLNDELKSTMVEKNTASSEEIVLNSDQSSSAEDLEEFPYSSAESQNPTDAGASGAASLEASVCGKKDGKSGSLVLNSHRGNSESLLKCLFCDNHTNVATSREAYLEHLRKKHKFIIANDHLISDFKKYIEYWRAKFQQKELTEYCSIIKTSMFPEDNGNPTVYMMLGDSCPQDRRLREHLQHNRLKLVLEQNQLERSEKNFSQKCLFCDMEFKNCNRSDLFEHMHQEHMFNVGHPDNLVFVAELLEILHEAINRNQCLHCDNIYESKEELFEHMKRKQHRKLNGKNTTYDKYYIINYLEMGRSWEDIMSDEDNDIWRELKREEFNWSDWKETNITSNYQCLFCSETFDSPEKFKLHLLSHHKFNFDALLTCGYSYTFFDQMKIVNFIRHCVRQYKCHFTAKQFMSEAKLQEHFKRTEFDSRLPLSGCWNHDSFLIPVIQNDAVLGLMKDVEDNNEISEVGWIQKEDFTQIEEASILQLGLDYIDENKLTAHTVMVLNETNQHLLQQHGLLVDSAGNPLQPTDLELDVPLILGNPTETQPPWWPGPVDALGNPVVDTTQHPQVANGVDTVDHNLGNLEIKQAQNLLDKMYAGPPNEQQNMISAPAGDFGDLSALPNFVPRSHVTFNMDNSSGNVTFAGGDLSGQEIWNAKPTKFYQESYLAQTEQPAGDFGDNIQRGTLLRTNQSTEGHN